MGTSTAAYRFNVSRQGKVCCRGDEIGTLCNTCQAQVAACTCESCQTDRHAATTDDPYVAPAAINLAARFAAERATRPIVKDQPVRTTGNADFGAPPVIDLASRFREEARAAR